MPAYKVTMPDGTSYKVTAPDEAALNQTIEQLKAEHPAKPQEAAQPSLGDQVGRQAKLAGRYAVEGLLSVPATLANPLAYLGNRAIEGVNALGGNIEARFPEQNAAVSDALTAAGLPQPQGGLEQGVGAASRALAGTGGVIGAAGRMAGPTASTLAANPSMQAASAVTGATAADVTRQRGGGIAAQTIASLAGGAVPFAIPAGTRFAARGGEAGRQTVADNIESFRAAGTTPTVGQATQSRLAQALESLLSRAPGGAGVMARKAEQQAAEIGTAMQGKAAGLSRRADAETAGRAIERGIEGPGGFLPSFRKKQGELYAAVDSALPPTTPAPMPATQKILGELVGDIKGAPNTSAATRNKTLAGITEGIEADLAANGGQLTYEAAKQIRSRIGAQIEASLMSSDVPNVAWKRLYGALTDDLAATVKSGGPKAEAAWNRANNYTRAGLDRLEAVSRVIERNGGPEKVFSAAVGDPREGATVMRRIMQSLPEEGQQAFTAAFLRRLGRAKAGAQNDTGDVFSTESFLTNWNGLSPQAKRVLFDRHGDTFRADMDHVAKVAANLRGGSQVFRNPSGTASAATQYATVGAFALAAMQGDVATAGTIAAAVGGANGTARLMTNPNFVRWLAKSTTRPITGLSASLAQLKQSGQDDPDVAEFVALAEKVGQ